MIHYFWQTTPSKAFGLATLFVSVFIFFWASGLWINASRHSWGILTPVFMLFILAGWLGLKFGPKICTWAFYKIKGKDVEK